MPAPSVKDHLVRIVLRIILPVLGAALLALLPGALQAQSLTVNYGWTNAGIDDVLERPNGFGAFLDVPATDRFSVRIAVRHHTEALTIRRSPCTGLVPPGADCGTRAFVGDAELTTVGAGLVVTLPRPISTVEPRLFAMGLVADVDAEFRAEESNEEIAPITPDDPTVGLAGGGSFSFAFSEYVGVNTQIGAQYVRFGTCGDDGWFAFCDSRVMPRISLGAEVHLSQLFEAWD